MDFYLSRQLHDDNRFRRQGQEKRSLLKTPPTQEEKEHLHDMFLHTKKFTALSAKRSHLPGHCVWMKDTALRFVITCYPEIVHTSGSEVQVYVSAEKSNDGEMTKDFHFTFDSGGTNLRSGIPTAYSDGLRFVNGPRWSQQRRLLVKGGARGTIQLVYSAAKMVTRWRHRLSLVEIRPITVAACLP
ncbi:hypothetical protein EGW08_001001 [Elysia chlorotica]|uniref:Uncharacterized protein n=1 Tax=Elysia chlorotica TaxID=188477 RepID=A0A433UBH7_ELYCH|nr:hypothetical protein EGW08_001001 [Elysia chlorotica]